MKRILVLLLCCSIFSAHAATSVSGIISSNTTWTKANSPYIVNGNLSVDSGVRLTIQPGVKVMVDSGYYFRIDGSLMAIGTVADSIIFTSSKISPSRRAWQGIAFTVKSSRDTSRIYYARFEYATNALATSIPYSLRVYYSTFRLNGIGISFSTPNKSFTSTIDVYHSLITQNDTGIYYTDSTGRFVQIAYCELSYNNIGIRQEKIYAGLSTFSSNVLKYNIIGYSSDATGNLGKTNACTYIGNLRYGVCIIGKLPLSGGDEIYQNTIMYSPTAIYIDTIEMEEIHYNTIAYNGIGIEDNKTYKGPFYTNMLFGYNNCYIKNKVYNYRSYSNVNRNSQGDYWGTTSAASIDSTIYDYYDDPALGKFNYTNINTTGNYCAIVSPPPPCFPQPGSFVKKLTSPGSATISWHSISGAPAYEYYFTPISTTPSSSGTITFDTSFNVTGLAPGQAYRFCVRTRCFASPFASAWTCDTFTTPCDSPINLVFNNINFFNATASWDTVAGATGYEFYILPHPSAPPAFATLTTNHTVYLTGLNMNTTYDFCVRTRCINSFSAWTCDTIRTSNGINTLSIENDVRIYPNPSNGTFTVSLSNSYTHATITVLDMTGRMVTTKPMHTATETITMGNAAKGVYTVRILTDNAVINKRIVIE